MKEGFSSSENAPFGELNCLFGEYQEIVRLVQRDWVMSSAYIPTIRPQYCQISAFNKFNRIARFQQIGSEDYCNTAKSRKYRIANLKYLFFLLQKKFWHKKSKTNSDLNIRRTIEHSLLEGLSKYITDSTVESWFTDRKYSSESWGNSHPVCLKIKTYNPLENQFFCKKCLSLF